MKKRILASTTAAALLSCLPAIASAPAPGVKGGGFIRGDDRAKTLLTITASDNGPVGDAGQATVVRHTPGSKAQATTVELDCVNVIRTTAYASGMGSDGKAYLIVIRDNGEGADATDEFGVSELAGATISCVSGGLVQQGVLGSITGGNFQVFSG